MDIRLQRMARVLVQYSLELQKGDHFAINTSPVATPLVQAVVHEAIKAGAFPEVFVNLPGVAEIIAKEGSDEQLSYISPSLREVMEKYEAFLGILSDENTRELSGVDPTRMALLRKARYALGRAQLSRTKMLDRFAPDSLRWSLAMFPTDAYAQDTNMSLTDFENFVYRACFLDDEDPVARWQEVSREQQRLIDWLKGRREVHLKGPGTDLKLSIEGRIFINDDGRYNFPGGEFFTGPIENSANGHIRYTFPTTFDGQSAEDVYLRFEDGKVVEATASRGQELLEKMLNLDEGARYLGEFAFGNNQNVDRITKNILFDEKMGGTVHLALGASIPPTGGVNQSALHWDMVCDLRTGSEIRVDGDLFSKDGKFVV